MRVYLDNSATTALDNDALKAMMPYFSDKFGNPSSLHQFGREALQAVDESRAKIASLIGAKPNEIYFTSGGSESDNWALKGTVYASKAKNKHIVTTAIEHPAILETCEYLEKKDGVKVSYVPSGKDGRVTLDAVKAAVTDDTLLVSVMFANNETGAIQPIKEIGEFCHEQGILFHTDAVQALGKTGIPKAGVDMISVSGHKVHGPKGTGALFIRRGLTVPPFMYGGGQEKNMRSGTENTPGIAGFGKACDVFVSGWEKRVRSMRESRQRLLEGLTSEIGDLVINSPLGEDACPSVLNVSFIGVRGEVLLHTLEQDGIFVSTGSACSSNKKGQSHVLKAMGLSDREIEGAVRFSFSEFNTKEEMDYVTEKTKQAVARFRKLGSFR